MANKKTIRSVQYVSSVALRAMEVYPEQVVDLIDRSPFAMWVQAKLEIDGVERVIRAAYRAGTVRLSCTTEA